MVGIAHPRPGPVTRHVVLKIVVPFPQGVLVTEAGIIHPLSCRNRTVTTVTADAQVTGLDEAGHAASAGHLHTVDVEGVGVRRVIQNQFIPLQRGPVDGRAQVFAFDPAAAGHEFERGTIRTHEKGPATIGRTAAGQPHVQQPGHTAGTTARRAPGRAEEEAEAPVIGGGVDLRVRLETLVDQFGRIASAAVDLHRPVGHAGDGVEVGGGDWALSAVATPGAGIVKVPQGQHLIDPAAPIQGIGEIGVLLLPVVHTIVVRVRIPRIQASGNFGGVGDAVAVPVSSRHRLALQLEAVDDGVPSAVLQHLNQQIRPQRNRHVTELHIVLILHPGLITVVPIRQRSARVIVRSRLLASVVGTARRNVENADLRVVRTVAVEVQIEEAAGISHVEVKIGCRGGQVVIEHLVAPARGSFAAHVVHQQAGSRVHVGRVVERHQHAIAKQAAHAVIGIVFVEIPSGTSHHRAPGLVPVTGVHIDQALRLHRCIAQQQRQSNRKSPDFLHMLLLSVPVSTLRPDTKPASLPFEIAAARLR